MILGGLHGEEEEEKRTNRRKKRETEKSVSGETNTITRAG